MDALALAPEPTRPARTYGSSPSPRPYGAGPSARPPRRDARDEAPRHETGEEAPRSYPRGAPKGTPCPSPAAAAERPRAPRERERGRDVSDTTRVVLAFSVGRDDGVRPADLVGAITGEAGIASRDLGAIRINDQFSTVEVSEGLATKVIKAMKGKTVRGEKVDVKLMGLGGSGLLGMCAAETR